MSRDLERRNRALAELARALQKKPKTALKLLRDAMDEGFDDGSRLDADKAFDSLRDSPEYRELRAKCR